MSRPLLRFALALLLAGGCVSLRPFAEIVATVPADEWVEVDGRRAHVVIRGSGFPLLLLHGFGASTLLWEEVTPGLARHRQTVAIDLHGFGWTERPRQTEAYTLAGQERLVLAVADRLGFAEFDLAGHSYGGAIALFLAARHPERVRSLLLVDNALPSYGVLRRSWLYASRGVSRLFVRTLGLRKGRIERGLRASYADESKVTDAQIRAYLDRLRVEGVEDAFYGLSAPIDSPPDEVDLTTIRQPTLVVWGAEDRLITPEEARRDAKKLPDSCFVELPSCGHMPMAECPAEFLAAVEPFFALSRLPCEPSSAGRASNGR